MLLKATFDIIGLMSKEREGGLSPEKAEHIYKEHFIPTMSEAVMNAEQARHARSHGEVERIFDRWTRGKKDQRAIEKLRQISRRAGVNLAPQEDEIKVGYAGLGRIEHVDANSQLKQTSEEQKDLPLERIAQAHRLYERLGLATLVPWTIHGGSIHWLSEVTQDEANTSKILGNEMKAHKILEDAILSTAEVCDGLEELVDLETPEAQLRKQNYDAWKNRKIYLGSLSAQGVLWARFGKLTRLHSGLTYGLRRVLEASQYEPNPHRVATLALWTIAATRSYRYYEELPARIKGGFLGVKSLCRAFIMSPQQAISAVRQFAKEGG